MSHRSLFARLGTISILSITLAISSWLSGCKSKGGSVDPDDESPQQSAAKKNPAQISVENGLNVITLDADTQNRLGLQTLALTQTNTREEQSFPAVALSVEDLATARNNYIAAQSQLQKARVEESVANREYTRLKFLYADDQSVAQKSLEAAEGALQSNQADVHAAEQQLALQKSIVAQQWGPTVAQWAGDGSPNLQRLLDRQDSLIQVSLPAEAALQAPKTISLQTLDGSRIDAALVSTFPRVDPRIQGKSFLYSAVPRSPLAPNTNLVAHIPVGGAMKGVAVPTSAVVWSEGNSWIYQQAAANRFTRHPISTDAPVANGFFISKGLSPGDKVVTVGAQALLSEEFLLRGASGGENDEN